MAIQTKYITADELLAYSGIDIRQQLKDDDNPSNTANAFLLRVETRMSAFLDAQFYRNVDQEYPSFTDYQKEHYKYALLEQCIYVLRNGEISTDSGYDPEQGLKASEGSLKSLSIAPNAKDQLMLCGLWCRHIKPRGRTLDGDWLY